MKTFDKYAAYYNLIYRDKEYAREVEFIRDIIRSEARDVKTILDLGCGTGRHDLLLADHGYRVTGIDGSEAMIQAAEAALKARDSFSGSVSFINGDVRSIRLDTRFDLVLSLFHVLSYQVSNHDIASAFETAKEHLKPGGLFIFDFWYGPAVLTDRPSVRIKRMEDEKLFVTRLAEPQMHPNTNTVDVDYHILIRDKANNSVEELKEQHVMRYLFLPEVDHLLKGSGLHLLNAAEWMTGKEPGFDTWNLFCVARRKGEPVNA